MPTVSPRNIKLSQTAIFGTKRKDLICNGVATRFKRDTETHLPTAEVEGYAVNVLSARGEVQTVKLPLEVESKIESIRSSLMNDKVVKVSFNGMLGKFWAMQDQNSGRILQGVSATANDMEVISIEDPSEDDFELDDIQL